jgi:hypothetical protein
MQLELLGAYGFVLVRHSPAERASNENPVAHTRPQQLLCRRNYARELVYRRAKLLLQVADTMAVSAGAMERGGVERDSDGVQERGVCCATVSARTGGRTGRRAH